MSVNWGGWTRYSENNSSWYFLKKLWKEYLSEVSDMFYAYKRKHTWDDWFAFKFKQLYFNKCWIVKWDLNNVSVWVNDYIDHIENASWWDCARSGWWMELKIEKIIIWKYIEDVCMNWTLIANWKHSRWNSRVTTDWRNAWFIWHRISNTTVITWPDWQASNRCAWVSDSNKANSETYIFVR
jgi:hypothetical protein